MSDLNVAERLGRMDEAWSEAPVQGTNEMPPNGVYQVKVKAFDYLEGKEGNLLLKTTFEVTTGEHSGWPITVFNDLEDPERLGWAKGFLARLGLKDVQPLSTLQERTNEVLDIPVEIAVKRTKKGDTEYANAYVNKRLGGPKPNGDEDIPF